MAAARAEAQALPYLFSLRYFSSNYIKWYSTPSYSSINQSNVKFLPSKCDIINRKQYVE
jgi:hypothetical protein